MVPNTSVCACLPCPRTNCALLNQPIRHPAASATAILLCPFIVSSSGRAWRRGPGDEGYIRWHVIVRNRRFPPLLEGEARAISRTVTNYFALTNDVVPECSRLQPLFRVIS